MPLDESGVVDAAYGPAGMVREGAEYEKPDREGLKKTYEDLDDALEVLYEHDLRAWLALQEPYFSDPADNSVVDDWREKIKALDEENARIRAGNEQRVKKGRPKKPEKVRHVFMRLQLERHDRAIEKLAHYLRNKQLYVVWPKLMSERERVAGEAANAQMVAYYERVRVAGRTHRGAVSQTAVKFEVSEERVEKVLEFRGEAKLSTCIESDCGRAVYSQNMCSRCYQRALKARQGKAS
jgi:hypothetical protein